MYNIDKLEERWKKYKYRQFAPYIIFGLCSIGVLVYFLLKEDRALGGNVDFEIISSGTNDNKYLIDKKMPLVIHGTFGLLEPEIVYDRVVEKICIKKPIVSFEVDSIEDNVLIDNSQTSAVASADVPTLSSISSQNSSKEVCLALPSESPMSVPSEKPKKIKFDTVDNIDAIGDIMRRFNKGKDPNDALFLSNNFYEAGDYSKALYWAIETNKITEDIEDGWLLMAKSKAKLGERQEAVRVLRAYSAKKMSPAASDLAREIESNEWN